MSCISKGRKSILEALETIVPGVSHAQRPPRQRLRCVPGMFNSLEVQVLYPT